MVRAWHTVSDTHVLSIYLGRSAIPLQPVSFTGIHDNSGYGQTGHAADHNEPAFLYLYVSLWCAYLCHHCWKCSRHDRRPQKTQREISQKGSLLKLSFLTVSTMYVKLPPSRHVFDFIR